jgi:ferrous iron transport protein B
MAQGLMSADGLVLVGNPNVGKSALFGALTGTYVTVSNYPGTTVEVTAGSTRVAGRPMPIKDTPGAASLIPTSEDERVTRDILLSEPPRAVVVVGDAKNLERALLLALQVAETGLPFVLCLNMMDEAVLHGIEVDAALLARRLGVDVVPTVAVRHEGLARLACALEEPRFGATRVVYPDSIEDALSQILPLLPEAPLAARALGLMVLAGDDTLDAWLEPRMDIAARTRAEDIRQCLRRTVAEPPAYVINHARLIAARSLARGVATRPRRANSASSRTAGRLDALTTHRFWGVPILAAVLYLAYLFVGVFGAKVLVDLLENTLFGGIVSPAATRLADRLLGESWLRDLLVGPYGVITMALAYSLALVLPIVGTFFIAFGMLEDSGYLPRLAVMVNRLFKKMGLNGKAVLPMVLGLGCDTMATLTTRILETPKERLIVILLLALGVPCSAQLTVLLAMFAGFPAWAFATWLVVVLGVIVVVGRLAAAVIPGRGSDFVLELPPLRWPRPRNILIKTVARVEWYLKEAVPLFVLGTLILFVADRLRLLGGLERLGEPIVSGLLGLPREATGAFLIGFLRRDFGAAGLYRLAHEGRLDVVQTVVALTTITLFIPCIAQFFMMVKERGWRTAFAIAAVVFPAAFGIGAALRLVLRGLGL